MFTYQEVRETVKAVRGDDTVDLFDQAVDIFDRLDYGQYISLFSETNSKADLLASPNSELVSWWMNDIQTLVRDCLRKQGFILNDQILISESLKILESVLAITELEDKAFVFRLLESTMDDRDIFAELVEQVSDLSPEDTLSLVNQVPFSFRDMMIEVYGQEVQLEQENIDPVLLKNIRASVQKYKECPSGSLPGMMDDFCSHNATLGLPMAVYVQMFLQKKNFDISDDHACFEVVARELFGLACMSSDGCTNPLQVCKSVLPTVFPDMVQQAQVEVFLRQIGVEYGNVKK